MNDQTREECISELLDDLERTALRYIAIATDCDHPRPPHIRVPIRGTAWDMLFSERAKA